MSEKPNFEDMPEEVRQKAQEIYDALLPFATPSNLVENPLAELAAVKESNRWISVEERLPESETVVIVYDRAKDIVCEGYLSSEAGGWCENTWWLRRLQNVTHWTPKVLPDAPKGGGA